MAEIETKLCLYSCTVPLDKQNHRIARVGSDLKRSSDPTFCRKESLDEII